ncbi:MAG TPA: response regulator, partial [Variovorax sp.]
MNAIIRVLHLEGDPGDAQRIRASMQNEELAFDIVWVQTREDFTAALQRQAFDLVLSDYELGGLDVLRHIRQQHPELPVITISAGLSEEEAVDCMKAGATDYVLKQRLRRLGFSIPRALAEQQQRGALRRAQADLRALNADLEARVHSRTAELETSNRFLDSVIQHIPHMVLVKRASDLTMVRVNRSVEKLLGRSQQELLGKTSYDAHTREEAEFFTAKDKEALALGSELDIPEETIHASDGRVLIL